MRRNRLIFGALLFAVLLACVSHDRLAKAEGLEPGEDRFAGFHLVYQRLGEEDTGPSYENWVEYGDRQMEVEGYGALKVPKMILLGEYDPVEQRYHFPGLEGYNCFLVMQEQPGGGRGYLPYSDLGDTEVVLDMEHNSCAISGTAWFGPPLDDRNWNSADGGDYGWTLYQVFQMPDGTVYLTGSGNSYGGVGGYTITTDLKTTVNVNGKAETQTFQVSVSIDSVRRTQTLSITQYDRQDRILDCRELPLDGREDIQVEPLEETDWLLVEQRFQDGAAERRICRPGEEIQIWLLDDTGKGYPFTINAEEGGGRQ